MWTGSNRGLFKNLIYKMCLEVIYKMYISKTDLALNNLQWLMLYRGKEMIHSETELIIY